MNDDQMKLSKDVLADGLGVTNIDHRLRQSDFCGQQDQPLFPYLGQSIEDLEHLNAALIVGGNRRKDQPIIGHRLRKAAQAGASVMFINPVDYSYTFEPTHKAIVTPARMVQSLAGVAAALLQSKKARAPHALRSVIDKTLPDATEQAMARALNDAGQAAVLLGIGAGMHPAFSTLRALAVLVAELSGAKLGFLSDGANSAGACLAGVLPHRGVGGQARETAGLDAAQMLAQPLKNYLLVGIEPELDCANAAAAHAAMHQAEFVVMLTPYITERMREYADVLLPINCCAETSGTYVNCEGRWQSFAAASRAPGASRAQAAGRRSGPKARAARRRTRRRCSHSARLATTSTPSATMTARSGSSTTSTPPMLLTSRTSPSNSTSA